MSDEPNGVPTDDELPDVHDIEALLRELDVEDIQPVAPPADVWAGIEKRVADSPAPVHSIAHRRRPTARWILAAAAAIVLVVAGTITVVRRRSNNDDVLSAAVLKFDAAQFDPRGAGASAQALLINSHGTYEIRLENSKLPSVAGDDLELWLIQPDAQGNPSDIAPVALVAGNGDGTYRVPSGLDPKSHYVVDISIEPRDGDAAHSGQSILRGPLEPA